MASDEVGLPLPLSWGWISIELRTRIRFSGAGEAWRGMKKTFPGYALNLVVEMMEIAVHSIY